MSQAEPDFEGASLDVGGRKLSIRELEEAETYVERSKTLALELAEQGDLKGAIDSMVSDLSKSPYRSEAKKEMGTRMGLYLRNKEGLSKKDVVDFIEGW